MSIISPVDLFEGDDKTRIAERISQVFKKGTSDAEANLVSREGKRTPYYFTGKKIIMDEEQVFGWDGIGCFKFKRS